MSLLNRRQLMLSAAVLPLTSKEPLYLQRNGVKYHSDSVLNSDGYIDSVLYRNVEKTDWGYLVRQPEVAWVVYRMISLVQRPTLHYENGVTLFKMHQVFRFREPTKVCVETQDSYLVEFHGDQYTSLDVDWTINIT